MSDLWVLILINRRLIFLASKCRKYFRQKQRSLLHHPSESKERRRWGMRMSLGKRAAHSSQELLKSCGNNRGAWHVWNLYLDSTRVRSDWFSHLWGIFGDENEPFVDFTLKVGIDWVFRFSAIFLGSILEDLLLSPWFYPADRYELLEGWTISSVIVLSVSQKWGLVPFCGRIAFNLEVNDLFKLVSVISYENWRAAPSLLPFLILPFHYATTRLDKRSKARN